MYGISTSLNIVRICDGIYESAPVYTTSGFLQYGDVIYADAEGTIPYTGYRTVYAIDQCLVYTLDSSTATVSDFGTACENCV
jgi:hypothetical protein